MCKPAFPENTGRPIEPKSKKIKTARPPKIGPKSKPLNMAIMSCKTIGIPPGKGIWIKQAALIRAANKALKTNFFCNLTFFITYAPRREFFYGAVFCFGHNRPSVFIDFFKNVFFPVACPNAFL